jgi:hypothetical protein
MKEMNLKMTKDYTLLIGKKFGDREVLDITRKHNGKWNAAFAICKCKCGSIDEIPMNQLKAGRRSRCPKCAEKNENKSTGIRHISYDKANDDFIITIERNGQRIIKHTRTLDEAILIKTQLLNHFEKYGCFEVEKLKDEHATSKCSIANVKKKYKKKRRVLNRYSHLIGQKLGDWEITHVSEPIAKKRSQRVVQMRNSHDETREIMLKSALTALQRDRRKPYRANTNTNIKNISYSKWLKRYQVHVIRNGVLKTGSSKDLEEAIKIKERILKEFEKESVVNG